jgi:nitroimidazol reductase NimA-like FMN-containing flavoprotein (pyridoxamine 5'-phosphate oxidase superfamily)
VEDVETPHLDEIPRHECFRLMKLVSVGRLALACGDEPPLVVPVNYIVDGEVVVFRTDPGAKLSGLRQRPASFQVDLFDHFRRAGWSVLLQGVAYEATDDEVAHLTLAPWVGERVHWVRLVPASVTGRRIRLPEFVRDSRGYL